MRNLLKAFWNDEQGMELIEYALFSAVLIAGGVAGAVALWGAVQNKFQDTADAISTGSL